MNRQHARPSVRAAWGIGGLVLVALLWQLYKAVMPADGVTVGGRILLPRSSDIAMPSIWQIVGRLGEPTTGAKHSQLLWQAVLVAALFTLLLTVLGWVLGTLIGFLLALLMQRFRLAEQALLPWVVLSQTVPVIAIAPLLNQWGGHVQFGGFKWDNWMSVVAIATYLAFFPVAMGALQGMKAIPAVMRDLMSVYSMGWWQEVLRVRLPNSMPYLLAGIRLSAVNALVGAIVAEVSIGLRGGLGRMIVEFAQSASSDPPKSWAPIIGSALVGLFLAGVVALIGWSLRRFSRGRS